MTKKLLLSGVLALILMSFLGCQNTLQKELPISPAGKGIVRLSLGVPARTLMPGMDTLYYVVTFTKEGAAEVSVKGNESALTAQLEAGDWDLTIKAYNSEAACTAAPGKPGLTGSDSVTVTEGVEITKTVALSAVIAGTGTLAYTVIFPQEVTTGILTLTPANGVPISIDLKEAYTGSWDNIPAEYYDLEICLTIGGAAGTVGDKIWIWTGEAHIYQGLTTAASYEAVLDEFAGQADQDAANSFKDDYATLRGKDDTSIAISDEAEVDAALAAYDGLTIAGQALLSGEKEKLEGFKAKIFTLEHAAALAKTEEDITAEDTTVSAALTAYSNLNDSVKALLFDEKDTLDSLAAMVAFLNIIPVTPTVTPASTDTIKNLAAEWTPVEGATGGYEVYYNSDGTDPPGSVAGMAVTSGTTLVINEGLAYATAYSVWVRAVRSYGTGTNRAGPWSAAETAYIQNNAKAITGFSIGGGSFDSPWELQDDGRRKSPAIGHNQTAVTRYNFTTGAGGGLITINLYASSEAGYDWAFVGNLDSAASMTQYYDSISGTDYAGTPRVITITVPSAGAHFIEIGYGKDGSQINGQDCAWFEIAGNSDAVQGVIDDEAKTISVIVPYGTSLSSLAPVITVSPGATASPASGQAQDFTNPVTYTVTAENGTTAEYTVTVTEPSVAAITVSFNTPGDQIITLSDTAEAIGRSSDDTLTVTDSTSYGIAVSRAWYVGSSQLADESGASVTLRARNYVAGTYSLSERVTLQNGTVYSKTVNFTVVE